VRAEGNLQAGSQVKYFNAAVPLADAEEDDLVSGKVQIELCGALVLGGAGPHVVKGALLVTSNARTHIFPNQMRLHGSIRTQEILWRSGQKRSSGRTSWGGSGRNNLCSGKQVRTQHELMK
jgi:hypothetical protein